MTLRRATPDDVPALLAISTEGMETYRDFAGEDFVPPDFSDLAPCATDESSSWWLAEDGGEPVGHALLIPATTSRVPSDDARLGHVAQVFVRPDHWGTPVAREVLGAIVEDAPRLGFAHLRLFTPADQHRARRFYVREGWTEVGTEEDTPLGFAMVEYRLGCPTPS
jgi:GNAT superfamily N-acetyltransferase